MSNKHRHLLNILPLIWHFGVQT